MNYEIKQHLSTPRYLQSNGKAEASNNIVLNDLKNKWEGFEGKWVDELPEVLWAYRTTKRCSIGETPFFLSFGTKAIIHPYIIVPSMSIKMDNFNQNNKQIKTNFDLLKEEQEKHILRVAACQQQSMFCYYKKK